MRRRVYPERQPDDQNRYCHGATRGIGLATTAQFVDQGWQVAMVDRDKDALADAADGRDGCGPLPVMSRTRMR